MDKYYLVNEEKAVATPLRVLEDPKLIRLFSSPLGWRVIREFSTPHCPMDVAKKLGIHEQKVYYYIKKFKEAKLLKEVGKQQRHGTIARFYTIRDTAFGLRLTEGAKVPLSVRPSNNLLEPFIIDGKMNARIVVGSPDPHGLFKARASDACCAIDLALFLGGFTFGRQPANYKLDVEMREKDIQGNLIVIGGPAVNMIALKVNNSLPATFDLRGEVKIKSKASGKEYVDDEVGLIAQIKNPFDADGKILLLAGKRFQGTRSAVLEFIKRGGDIKDFLIVKGYDLDGDGIIDSTETVE